MFNGYLEFGGIPLINSEATEAYVAHQAPGLGFRPTIRSQNIHVANEEAPYESPFVDDAPWVTETEPDTADFYGLYPLEIQGIDDSTMSAPVTERLADGGSVGAARDGSRSIRVHGLLIGGSAEGAQAGLSWLREAVRSDDCSLSDECGGASLRYFIADPDVCDTAFTDEEVEVARVLGTFGVGPVTYRWTADQVPLASPIRFWWTGQFLEGTVITFGATARFDGDPVFLSQPVKPLRKNYALNPTLRSDLTGWTTLSGSADWQPTGGADGSSWARVSPSDGTGGGGTGSGSGGYGEGGYGDGGYGDSSNITGGTGDPGTPVPAGAPSIAGSTAFFVEGAFSASVALRSTTNTLVTIVATEASSGAVLGSTVAATGTGWARFAVSGTHDAGSVTFTLSATEAFDFDQVLVELGPLALDYFDGYSATTSEYLYGWDGTVDASASSARLIGTLELDWPDANIRPLLNVVAGQVTNLTLNWGARSPIPVADQLQSYERVFHDVACVQGPQVIQEYSTHDGAHFIEVDLVFVAGQPHPWAPPLPVSTIPLTSLPFTDPAATVDQAAHWLMDPDCLPVTAPPAAPVILDDCLDVITAWQRYYVAIPAADVSAWGVSVPTIGINSYSTSVKQVRIRFHPNPFSYEAERVDPLNYCGEMLLSYLPSRTRLVLNGITHGATATKSSLPTMPADHLVYGSDGGPVTWPELSCAIPYVMTIDVPSPADKALFDVDLALQKRG